MSANVQSNRRDVQAQLNRLGQASEDLEKKLEEDGGYRDDEAVEGWLNSLQNAYNELEDIYLDIRDAEGDVEDLLGDAAEEVSENVIEPFYQDVFPKMSGYDSYFELFDSVSSKSHEEPLAPDLAARIDAEFDQAGLKEVRERYQIVVNYGRNIMAQKESDESGDVDWSKVE